MRHLLVSLTDKGEETDDRACYCSDDDDEEAELMRELEKIKQEREEERLRQEAEAQRQAEEKTRDEILHGNPLSAPTTAKMKRRWNDDVVFKNQSRYEPQVKRRFINDTIRNDFHRRFLNKYMQ